MSYLNACALSNGHFGLAVLIGFLLGAAACGAASSPSDEGPDGTSSGGPGALGSSGGTGSSLVSPDGGGGESGGSESDATTFGDSSTPDASSTQSSTLDAAGGAPDACAGAICGTQNWNDITAAHSVPAWVLGAKLGIGIDFTVATVLADNDDGFIQHEYCDPSVAAWTSTYFPAVSPLSGGPWGYKDFIPLFTVSLWAQPAAAHAATNATSWAALFKASGATYVNATGTQYDRFAMWDSTEPASIGGAGTWNAARMGPMRDIVGELGAAVKAQGMKFGVNNHFLYAYSFVYCGPNGTTAGNVGPNTPASVSDLYDPRYASFYGPPNPGCVVMAADGQCSPSQAFCDDWLYRAEELVDKYLLDDEWFDWDGATVAGSPCMIDKLAFALHYYQTAAARGQEVQCRSCRRGESFPT